MEIEGGTILSEPERPEVVVITGASAGNGRAIVRAFAKRGAHIGLLARGHAGLEERAATLRRWVARPSPSPPMRRTRHRLRRQPGRSRRHLAPSISGSMTP